MSRAAWVVVVVAVVAAVVTAAGVTYGSQVAFGRATEAASRSSWAAEAPTTVLAEGLVADADGPLAEVTAVAEPSASFPAELSTRAVAEPLAVPRVSVPRDHYGAMSAG